MDNSLLMIQSNEEVTIEKAEEYTARKEFDLVQLRDWFKADVDHERDFQDAAEEDYNFFFGDQWKEADKVACNEAGRPAITINRCKPLIKLLSGYQRLNRYEPDFLPRTKSDLPLCNVRKGMTKFVFDQCSYEDVEARVFMDAAICGRGWLEVMYDWNFDQVIGQAKIKRVSPFDIYVDCESREPDLSDAEHIFRAKWASKERLKIVYPEHADEIEFWLHRYDPDERNYSEEFSGGQSLWYQQQTKKVRIIECWYKEFYQKYCYLLADGSICNCEEYDLLTSPAIIQSLTVPAYKMMVAVFLGGVLLEKKESPYEHNLFPYVQLVDTYIGEGDAPSGVIRDIKDVQREINKRRSQNMHILNTQSNSGWLMQEGSVSDDDLVTYEKYGSSPGVVLKYTGQKPERITPAPMAGAVIQEEQQSQADIHSLTNINPEMMGSMQVPSASSGKAIELRQRQAVTGITMIFDNLRIAKKQCLKRLWGHGNRKGIIQQYYTDEMTFRVIGDTGQSDFITVNQQVQVNDPVRGAITQVLNDLTVGEFDIVISDTPTTATQRISQFWAMVDAVSRMGIPYDLVFDLILDMSDLPNKDQIIQRYQERQQKQEMMQQQAAMAAQQKGQQAKGGSQDKVSQSINFKDLPPDGQDQLAAKAGIRINQAQQIQANVPQPNAMQMMYNIGPDGQPQIQPQLQYKQPEQTNLMQRNTMKQLLSEIGGMRGAI